MPTLELTQGQRARVDWSDYRELSKHEWWAQYAPDTRSFYAVRTKLQMHRVIMGLGPGDRRQVDHKNWDTLDNRRRNLRICTNRENAENRRNQSRWGVGVRRHVNGKFQAHTRIGARWCHIGYFATAEEARAARRGFLDSREDRR